ncbi:MAG: hypothetical protein L5655_04950 [Thermosediminibacteraceae bacterium]|nr:hypothetical protein [Thermosediminibacteraceae bacterium]
MNVYARFIFFLICLNASVIITLVTPSSLIIRFLFLFVSMYLIFTSFFGRYYMFYNLFHPYIAYRLILMVTMVLQVPRSILKGINFSEETYITILLTVLSFFVAMDIVIYLFPKIISIPSIDFTRNCSSVLSCFFVVIYFMSWLWRAFSLAKGLFHGTLLATQLTITTFSNIIGQLNNIGLLALIGYAVFNGNRKPNLIVFLMVIGEIVWMLIYGSKAAILYVLLPMIFIYFYKSKFRVSWKSSVIIISLLFLMLIFFKIGQDYRIAIQKYSFGDGLSFQLIMIALKSTLEENKITNLAINLREIIDNVLERLNWAYYYGALLEQPIVLQEKWYGKSYLPIFFWWIPRAVWSEKPPVSVGNWYGRTVLGWTYDTRSEGAITLWGDAMMNFGILGVLMIQIVWIILVFSIYRLGFSLGNWGFFFLASVYVRLLLGLEQNAAVPLVAIQQTALIIWIFSFFTKIFRWLYNNFKLRRTLRRIYG